MEGYASTLRSLGEIEKLEIPFFQRPYVWGEPQFDALVNSFVETEGSKMPFFGSIILKKNDEWSTESPEYSVIDGQQRLTTFSILIRALLDAFEETNTKISPTAKHNLEECVYKTLLDNDMNEVFSLKLIPSNADKVFYEKVMDSDSASSDLLAIDDPSPILGAYKYFYNYFLNNPTEKTSFGKKLLTTSKSFIFIILDNNDDEQKIFDSVNSLGKTLSCSDIIKNYLFHRMKALSKDDDVIIKKIHKYYYTYWDEIFYENDKKDFWYKEIVQGRFRIDNLECFLKDFATIKKIYAAKKTIGSDGLCRAYKNYIDNCSLDELFDLLKELSEYATVFYEYKTNYENLKDFKWSDYQNRLLLIFDKLDTSTFDPYILKILKEKPDDIEDKFFNLERFFLKRFIFDGTTKNYNQCCEGLLNSSDDKSFFEKYMGESPVSDDYRPKLRKLTNKQGALLIFLLELLHRNGEENKYSDILNFEAFSLEHIMPQKWQEKWLSCPAFDEDGNQISDIEEIVKTRNMAVRSLGNFALLTANLNSSISNDVFSVKIDGNTKKSGMRQYASALAVTNEIIKIYDNSGKWDERDIFAHEKNYFDILNGIYSFI